jgi:Rifampin ADP-ribosyl transferase
VRTPHDAAWDNSNEQRTMTASDNMTRRRFYHGTRAGLKPGDLIAAGYSSNYGARKKASWVYLTGTLDAAIWGAELATGDGRERIYIVERQVRSWMTPTSRTRNFRAIQRSPIAPASRSGSRER